MMIQRLQLAFASKSAAKCDTAWQKWTVCHYHARVSELGTVTEAVCMSALRAWVACRLRGNADRLLSYQITVMAAGFRGVPLHYNSRYGLPTHE